MVKDKTLNLGNKINELRNFTIQEGFIQYTKLCSLKFTPKKKINNNNVLVNHEEEYRSIVLFEEKKQQNKINIHIPNVCQHQIYGAYA